MINGKEVPGGTRFTRTGRIGLISQADLPNEIQTLTQWGIDGDLIVRQLKEESIKKLEEKKREPVQIIKGSIHEIKHKAVLIHGKIRANINDGIKDIQIGRIKSRGERAINRLNDEHAKSIGQIRSYATNRHKILSSQKKTEKLIDKISKDIHYAVYLSSYAFAKSIGYVINGVAEIVKYIGYESAHLIYVGINKIKSKINNNDSGEVC